MTALDVGNVGHAALFPRTEAVDKRLDELRARQRGHIPAPVWAMTPLRLTRATDLTAALRRQGAIR